MRERLSNRDYQQISAYLDEQLTQSERRRFEERLRAHPELQAALDELSRTRALLRQAPRRRAPRNFTLTPAMAEEYRPRPRRASGGSFNLFPALSFASALAALALVATLVVRLLPGQAGALPYAAAPTGQSREVATAAAAPAAAAPAQPPTAANTMAAAAAAGAASKAADNAVTGGPVVNWNGGMVGTYGVGGGGATGGAVSGGAANSVPYLGDLLGPPVASSNPPRYAAPAYGMGGASGPVLMIPPEAAKGLTPEPQAQAQGIAPAQTTSQLSGPGPILGLPPAAEGGQIIDQRSIQGFPTGPSQPSGRSGAQTGAVPEEPAAQPAQSADTLFGLPRLTVLQILLGVIAVAAGAAAVIVRRRGA
jgi:hypothetical protein